MSTTRPLPQSSEETEPFWTGLKCRKLLLQTCEACGKAQYYPRLICRHCQSRALAWQEVEPHGTVYSFSVVHRAPSEFAGDLPFITAVVELPAGPRVFARLVNTDPNDVRIGMKVIVAWGDDRDSSPTFNFEPGNFAHA